MKHITSTVLTAGARKICADSREFSLSGMGSIPHQPGFRPVSRRAIMSAVNTCSRELGIRQGAVVVLDALLSCLPCQGPNGSEIPVTPATLLTVYASNETLCFRAKGLTDRQLRRHIETLEKAGLLVRRDSANGKRFPIMKGGKAIGAFGLDLSPLFARADDLLALALKRREQAAELRGVRAQILRLRAACLELHLDETTATFVDGLRNLVRRATLTLVEAHAALARLTTVIGQATSMAIIPSEPASATHKTDRHPKADDPHQEPDLPSTAAIILPMAVEPDKPAATGSNTSSAPATDKTPAYDGQNVRHIEPESDTKKRKPSREHQPRWADLTEVSAFYDAPGCHQDTAAIAFEFGKMLRISQTLLASAAAKLGLWELLRIEDQIARKVETIRSPDAYLQSILTA
ncbi:helix-turn-helix domain-containing protein [Paenirhodobacter populi]|uniref:Replication protein C n=1 Tax=Paenirhodobacter populi TaxID=2306993 RepID=A0A443JA12_9RHOB|nr:helix-turn-helix domain-containing protein [Sinirhodobacter populi]RWR04101.1 replication protein C [Sinirhodobacter populi]RWR17314.1 replication protein C [Sinirhodobacter populi]